jgi:hypothetical protein
MVKTIINHLIFDGLYHLFTVKLGMIYYCFTHMICFQKDELEQRIGK